MVKDTGQECVTIVRDDIQEVVVFCTYGWTLGIVQYSTLNITHYSIFRDWLGYYNIVSFCINDPNDMYRLMMIGHISVIKMICMSSEESFLLDINVDKQSKHFS